MTDAVADIQARKKLLRRQMRQKRLGLSRHQQRQAARALFKRLKASREFRFSRHITFTIARDGEISPRLLLAEALRRGKRCYLPVMSRVGEERLTFRRITKEFIGLRATNRFAIPEPVRARACPRRALSLVLLPLVAFDADCNRLGMGKGFYDHSFAFLRRGHRQRPLLLGLAHECQKVDALELNPWDVPLHGIVTDRAWYKAPKKG
ncbi:MAG TPA: 5-formyltetrahydrofolate cyclo-ligase [Candidatus Acidoferrum sp.]|nr:5-formyltetrahydrofolate cyclo-ligase [Candidatus Acidoferrum sp.]